MSDTKITETLARIFADGAKAVFWNDAEGEFESVADSLNLPGVDVVRIDREPALKVKILVEHVRPDGCWLFYSPTEEPAPSEDWLADLRLRSKIFRADAASILLDELGLATQSLRAHLKIRARFLRSRERVERLKRQVRSEDSSADLDRKMLAVLSKAEQPDPFSIFVKTFAGLVSDGLADLDATSKVWADIQANDLCEAFWILAEGEFGYTERDPSIRDLLTRIFVTDMASSLTGSLPSSLAHFVLPSRGGSANAAVLCGRWRSDITGFASYNALSEAVSRSLDIPCAVSALSADALADVLTFEEIEKRVIQELRDRILAGAGANMDAVRSLVARRRDGHWANRLLAQGNDGTQALAACYDALEAGAGFFECQAKHAKGFSFPDATAGFEAYRIDAYKFDQLYRRFMRASEIVEPLGWGLLRSLKERIEETYSGWFVPQLASAWDKVVDGDKGLLADWRLPGVVNQQDFHERIVEPAFGGGAKRVFVIISDAFRYEAAEELSRELAAKSRVKASLDAMLGVLPSYTTLGMAALLPHKEISYKPNLGVSVDGMPTASIDNRSAVLASCGGKAVTAGELLEMGKEAGREFVRPHRLIYIYHDRIDSTGDDRKTETQTFEAVEGTVGELARLIGFVLNSLNGSVVVVTADHGFIYQEAPLAEADRNVSDREPEGALRSKKRYLIGRGLAANPKVWAGNTSATAGTAPGDGSVDFWLPKGAARFHFVGGARFVHGSAMPQEIVVPVLTIRENEGDKVKARPAEFSPIGSANRVVTNKQRFEFIQMEALSDRVLARTVLVSLRDGEALVSDEQAVTFDSRSQTLDDRKRSVILTVRSGDYDRTKDYWLVARDAQSKAEVLRIPFRIDLAISNDF
jgi:uncharacterized protein (TIGR02687 family)